MVLATLWVEISANGGDLSGTFPPSIGDPQNRSASQRAYTVPCPPFWTLLSAGVDPAPRKPGGPAAGRGKGQKNVHGKAGAGFPSFGGCGPAISLSQWSFDNPGPNSRYPTDALKGLKKRVLANPPPLLSSFLLAPFSFPSQPHLPSFTTKKNFFPPPPKHLPSHETLPATFPIPSPTPLPFPTFLPSIETRPRQSRSPPPSTPPFAYTGPSPPLWAPLSGGINFVPLRPRGLDATEGKEQVSVHGVGGKGPPRIKRRGSADSLPRSFFDKPGPDTRNPAGALTGLTGNVPTKPLPLHSSAFNTPSSPPLHPHLPPFTGKKKLLPPPSRPLTFAQDPSRTPNHTFPHPSPPPNFVPFTKITPRDEGQWRAGTIHPISRGGSCQGGFLTLQLFQPPKKIRRSGASNLATFAREQGRRPPPPLCGAKATTLSTIRQLAQNLQRRDASAPRANY